MAPPLPVDPLGEVRRAAGEQHLPAVDGHPLAVQPFRETPVHRVAQRERLVVFLTDYRLPIMTAGILVNALGVLLAARRLRSAPVPAGASVELRITGLLADAIASWTAP